MALWQRYGSMGSSRSCWVVCSRQTGRCSRPPVGRPRPTLLLQSLVWQVGRSRGLFILLMALFLAFAMPLGVEYLLPHLLEPDDRVGWTGLTIPAETLLVCGTTWLLAYFLAVNGVARDRRGDAWSFDWLARVGRLPSESRGATLDDRDLAEHASPRFSFAVRRTVLVRMACQGAHGLSVRAGHRRGTVGLADHRTTRAWKTSTPP